MKNLASDARAAIRRMFGKPASRGWVELTDQRIFRYPQ
jgi:hypothetical protein